MSLERSRPRRPRRGGGRRSWESEEGGGTHRVDRQDGHRSRAGAPGFSADIRRPMDDADSGCHANGRNRAPRVERNPCCPAKVTVAWGSKTWRGSRPDSPQKTVLKIVKRVGPGGRRSAERQLPEVEGPAEPRRTAPSFLLANLNTLSTIILRSSSGVTFLKSNVSLKLFLPSQSTRSPRPSFSTSAAGTDATDALGASPNAAFDLFP